MSQPKSELQLPPISWQIPFGLCPPKKLSEVLFCAGRMAEPAMRVARVVWTVETLVLPMGEGAGLLTKLSAAPRGAAIAHGAALAGQASQLASDLPGQIYNLGSEVGKLRLGAAGASEALEQGLNVLGAEYTKTVINGVTHFVAGAPKGGVFNAFKIAETGEVTVTKVQLVNGVFQAVK